MADPIFGHGTHLTLKRENPASWPGSLPFSGEPGFASYASSLRLIKENVTKRCCSSLTSARRASFWVQPTRMDWPPTRGVRTEPRRARTGPESFDTISVSESVAISRLRCDDIANTLRERLRARRVCRAEAARGSFLHNADVPRTVRWAQSPLAEAQGTSGDLLGGVSQALWRRCPEREPVAISKSCLTLPIGTFGST